jgi:hypothetical protein
MDEIDIWRTATLLRRLYGEGAAFDAAQRADALLEKGDEVGFAVWVKVLQLERQKSPQSG